MKIVDLSHLMNVHTPGWVGYAGNQMYYAQNLQTKMIVAQRIDTALHVGTHIDGAMHETAWATWPPWADAIEDGETRHAFEAVNPPMRAAAFSPRRRSAARQRHQHI